MKPDVRNVDVSTAKRQRQGRASRHKGGRVEREAVEALRAIGFEARKIPLSGASDGYPGDVSYTAPSGEIGIAEVKARKNGAGWLLIRRWLEGADALILKENNQPFLIVMTIAELGRLLGHDGRAPSDEGATNATDKEAL